MKKRTSTVVKFCSKHGKFIGFAWGGHRRICRNGKEVSESQWYASLKPGDSKLSRKETEKVVVKSRNAAVRAFKLPVVNTAIQKALEKTARVSNPCRVMPVRKPGANPKVSLADNLVGDIQSYLGRLAEEEEKLLKVKAETDGKLSAIYEERGRIKEALKKLV